MRPYVVALFAAALAGASSSYADDPTMTFVGTNQTFGVVGNYGDRTTQAGDDILQAGDYATGNVFVGETTTGSGPLNGIEAAPSVYAKAFAEGDYSGTSRAFVSWDIKGTLGPIPTIATGIPVLLEGSAYTDYDASTFNDPNSTAIAAHAVSYALIQLSGVTDPQSFYCGGTINYSAQSCGLNDVSDDFRLLPTSTPGVYEGYVSISATSSVIYDLGTTVPYTDEFRKTATTIIDPTVTIDQAFYARYPNAKLTFNPIVGNDGNPNGLPIPSSAAPEPAAWALMITGLGLIGVARRGRKQIMIAGRPV